MDEDVLQQAVRREAKAREFPLPVEVRDSGYDDQKGEYYITAVFPTNMESEQFGVSLTAGDEDDEDDVALEVSHAIDATQSAMWDRFVADAEG